MDVIIIPNAWEFRKKDGVQMSIDIPILVGIGGAGFKKRMKRSII